MAFNGLHLFRVLVYAGLVLVVITLGWWADWFDNAELAVRIVGFCLQVLGFGIVLFDVTAAARKHKVPLILSVIKAKLRKKHVLEARGIATGSATVKGVGAVATVTSANPTLEERVQMIEQRQETIKQDVNSLRKETRNASKVLSSRLESRAGELAGNVQQIRDDMRDAAAGLIHIEVVGVWLFGVGSFLSTFSKEISECSYLMG